MGREYDKLRDALSEVRESGWGVVMPSEGDLEISEPQLVRSGAQWGVRVGACAEAIHLVRTYIRTEVSPAVGTEEQAAQVAKQLTADYESDPASLLESKLFGKSMSDLVSEGIAAKLCHMPQEARQRMGSTIERIINEGASGLICILV
jgi:stage IV sporulation protein A